MVQFVDKKQTVEALCADGLVRGGVDNSSWMHKALYRVSCEFCEDKRNQVTAGLCQYYKERIDMLGRCGVKFLAFVFDGARLPSKETTKKKREVAADSALGRAVIAKAALGNKPNNRLVAEYKKICNTAVQRTEWMDEVLFHFLDNYKGAVEVRFVVAVFEADAQAAQLVRDGVVDWIIAEDQDLTMFARGRYVQKLGFNPKASRTYSYKGNECDFLDTTKWDGAAIGNCGLSTCIHI